MPPFPFTLEALLRFLRETPLTSDPDVWVVQFKTALCELLPDVDRVSLMINFHYDLGRIEKEQIVMIEQERRGPESEPLDLDDLPPDTPDEVIAYFRGRGHLVEPYHIPLILNFAAQGRERLATLYLWRKAEEPPISDETLEMVLSLHALFISLFVGILAQQVTKSPQHRGFIRSLATLVRDTNMTANQNQIVIQLLDRYSQEEIAQRMNVTVDAIKRTMGRLYKKAGVRSFQELQMKYFVPRSNKGSERGSRNGATGNTE